MNDLPEPGHGYLTRPTGLVDENGKEILKRISPPTIPPQPEPIRRSSEPPNSPSLWRQFLCNILGLHAHKRVHDRPGYLGSRCIYCPDEHYLKIPPPPPRRVPKSTHHAEIADLCAEIEEQAETLTGVPPHPSPAPMPNAYVDELSLEYAKKIEELARRFYPGGELQQRAAVQVALIEFANKINPPR